MEWFWGLIGGPLVGGLVSLLPEALLEQLRTRGALRAMDHEARLAEVADERRQAAQLAYLDEDHRRQQLLERYKNQNATYPLGAIGRLRDLAAEDPRPSVLVSPVRVADAAGRRRIPGLVHDALHDVDGLDRYAVLHTGAFVSDGDATRAVEGSVGAAEISALEFPSRPAIVVYFEADGDRLHAFAYLGSVFPSTEGRAGFTIRIASFGRGGPPTTRAEAGAALPVWPYVNLSEVDSPDEQVIAAIVAWFVVTCVETYWHLRGITSVDLRTIPRASNGTNGSNERPAVALIDRVGDAEDVFGCRLEMEALALFHLGFAPVETLEFGPDRVALIASREGLSISFLLDADFPAGPPEVFYVDAGGREHLEIDPSIWSPERTLADIVEAIR
ncbi:hypothetical protein [Thermomonospora umbrina]|uniref:Uncharacterized protein n=1 Tax=Thermomonospora umbrina TaxID=111806 RepID=A0A3D9SLX4_9ACTN|nr:hypothetical protein [Thermomonospora umbrina]REE96922.1 hypothetical protein DFJ69_2375 [Thermomonospora umbrina]